MRIRFHINFRTFFVNRQRGLCKPNDHVYLAIIFQTRKAQNSERSESPIGEPPSNDINTEVRNTNGFSQEEWRRRNKEEQKKVNQHKKFIIVVYNYNL